MRDVDRFVPLRLNHSPLAGTDLAFFDSRRFCDAMIKIRGEIDEIISGKQPRDNNTIINAPHPQQVIISDSWDRSVTRILKSMSFHNTDSSRCQNRPYTREQAAYPDARLRRAKFWPSVSRVDDAYGDKNLFCECGTVDEYAS